MSSVPLATSFPPEHADFALTVVLVIAVGAVIVRYTRRSSATSALGQGPACGRSQHCIILGVDVAEFTDRQRNDEAQLAIRKALYGLLIHGFEISGIAWKRCLYEDRGDGALVIVPAEMPTIAVIDPLLTHLRKGLRRHNRKSPAAAQIRLRVALHIGEVHHDEYGLAGTAVNYLCRLLDAPVLRSVLASQHAELALILSEYLYESVVRHAPGGVDLSTYRPVTADVKRAQVRAWIHLPPASSPARSDVLPDLPTGDRPSPVRPRG